MRRIFIRDIQPGDMLVMPVKLPRSGIALLKEGTFITPKHIEYLNGYGLGDEECFILDPNEPVPDSSQTDKAVMQYFRADIMQSIENMELKQTLTHTCIALQGLEKEIKAGQEISLQPIQDAAQQLLRQVLKDNAIMMQLAALKAISDYTFSHSINVAIYAITFGRNLGLKDKMLEELALSGLLHDIGKMSVPMDIIDKPGKLTREEFDRVKRHTYEGHQQLAKKSGISNNVLQGVLQHHERLDGSGYPLQLQSKKIHPFARMLSIVDVYDALTSRRCYREAVLPHETVDYLMGMASQGAIDLEMLAVYLKNIPIYPEGCQVTLSNGKRGTVVSTPLGAPLRPVIEVTSISGSRETNSYSATDQLKVRRRQLELDSNHTVFITGLVSR